MAREWQYPTGWADPAAPIVPHGLVRFMGTASEPITDEDTPRLDGPEPIMWWMAEGVTANNASAADFVAEISAGGAVLGVVSVDGHSGAVSLSGSYASVRSALGLAGRTRSQIARQMATPPTVGAIASATAIASAKLWNTTYSTTDADLTKGLATEHFTFLRGGNLTKAGTAFPDYTYVTARSLYPNTGVAPFSVEFEFDGTLLEVRFKGLTGALRLWVDDELVAADDVTVTTIANDGATDFLPVTFAARAVRKVRVDFSNGYFGGVNTGPNDTVRAVARPAVRCIVVGDSFTEGTGATSPLSAWPERLRQRTGWDVWQSAKGGTGYIAVGTSAKFIDRLAADVYPFAPQVVVVAGGLNDIASSASMPAAAAALFAAIRTNLPNAVLIATSPFWHGGVETYTEALLATRDAIRTAVLAAGGLFVDVIEGRLDRVIAASTLASSPSGGATTFSSNVHVPIGVTIEIGTGLATRERRVVTGTSGNATPVTLTVAALTNAHTAGETLTRVGPSLWTGTGQVGGTTGVGNSDLLVSADATHPSQAGHNVLGHVLADEILYALLV